jgi:putative alpha-1,2-mannosidase
LIDHLLEDDEEFDPYYILPNGYKLLLGSLLRFMFNHKDEPDQIELIAQSTYVTLFASEMGYDLVDDLVEDMVVKSALVDFDSELKKLLERDTNDTEGGA